MAIPVISLIAAIFSWCSAEAIRETQYLNDKTIWSSMWISLRTTASLHHTLVSEQERWKYYFHIHTLIKKQFQFQVEYLHR